MVYNTFYKKGDVVLDPFMGSGTTIFVANKLGRSSIGIDIVKEYCEMVKTKFKEEKKEMKLFSNEVCSL